MNWIDVTNYSQGTRGKATPRSWETQIAGQKILVTRHIHYPDTWFCCAMPYLNSVDLKTDELDTAKSKAIALFKQELVDFREKIGNLLDEIEEA